MWGLDNVVSAKPHVPFAIAQVQRVAPAHRDLSAYQKAPLVQSLA